MYKKMFDWLMEEMMYTGKDVEPMMLEKMNEEEEISEQKINRTHHRTKNRGIRRRMEHFHNKRKERLLMDLGFTELGVQMVRRGKISPHCDDLPNGKKDILPRILLKEFKEMKSES